MTDQFEDSEMQVFYTIEKAIADLKSGDYDEVIYKVRSNRGYVAQLD
ncbi:hypothetical protein [Paenibacillus kribbensis]|nr:hypothetical protein [Paenibacillus kribbensis]